MAQKYMVTTYNGNRYRIPVPERDVRKVNKYKNEILSDIKIKTGKWPTLEQQAAALRQAMSKEEGERYTKAKDDYVQANGLDKLANDGASNPTYPNGGVKSGDPGISRRRDSALDPITGAKAEDPNDDHKGEDAVYTPGNSVAEIEDLITKLNKIIRTSSENIGQPAKGYTHTPLVLPESHIHVLEQVLDIAYQSAGSGHPENQVVQSFSRLDRNARTLLPKNSEYSGYTFITRPRLNLTDQNLVADRKFAGMMTNRYVDVAYGLRCMLDSEFGAHDSNCPLNDKNNPFCVLLCNNIQAISGFQDPSLAVETTDGGFFSENQTYAIGGDRMAQTYDIAIQFRDIYGGPVCAAFDYWYQYMANLQDGTFIQYADAIDANRLDYTVSIYRFILDRSRKYITKWAKCTGCFPINAPTGVPFNQNQGEQFIGASGEFTITFKANHIGYNDPIILKEFDMLVERYFDKARSAPAYANDVHNNFVGIPYVRLGDKGYELMWLQNKDNPGEATTLSSASPQGTTVNVVPPETAPASGEPTTTPASKAATPASKSPTAKTQAAKAAKKAAAQNFESKF